MLSSFLDTLSAARAINYVLEQRSSIQPWRPPTKGSGTASSSR